MARIASLIVVARRLAFIRETLGQNRGAWVGFIQRFTGNGAGDSWCASFMSLILDIAYNGQPPLARTASADAMYRECRNKGFLITSPVLGCLFFYLNSDGIAHHVGISTAIAPLTGIAGNTSPDGLSANGDGVYEHIINETSLAFAALPE